ncbi:MFS transporter [Microvirga sp. W0021]|uniref:MFS transporter n=1 Tax=Hohaiivirga grylli TaxID=3133970 RepID=A0ABV0BHW2_9HYPH
MRKARIIPLTVATALFMENVDGTVLSTSLQAIAQDFGIQPLSLKLALMSYMISLAIFIPICGWVADRFGAKTVFRSALCVFILGSIACAAANSLEWFVFARFVQGMGAAMMVPVGRLILLRSVPKAEVVSALATLTIPALVGPVIGPPLGGFITTYFHWRWIFLINIPVAVLGLVMATIFFDNLKEDDTPPLDLKGFILSGLALSLVMFGLATTGGHMLPLEISISCIVIGLACGIGYFIHSRNILNPVLKISLLKVQTFRSSVIGGMFFRIGTGSVPFLLPLMLQIGFGMSPVQSGMLTFVAALGALFTKTIGVKVLRITGFKWLLIINAFLASAFLAAQGFFTVTTSHSIILTVLFIGGCFRSMQFTSLNALAFADISKRDMSYATSFSAMMQQLSLSLGVTMGAFGLEMAQHIRGDLELLTEDFKIAFLFVAAISAISGFIFMRLPANAGEEMSGHIHNTRK